MRLTFLFRRCVTPLSSVPQPSMAVEFFDSLLSLETMLDEVSTSPSDVNYALAS